MRTGTAVFAVQQSTAAGGSTSEVALDLEHLRRFTLGDSNLEREVLTLFSEYAPLTIAQLRAATTEKGWHDAAHSLKGSAGAIGAACLARAAAYAEQLKGQPERWSSAIAQLDAAMGATLAMIACHSTTPDNAAPARA